MAVSTFIQNSRLNQVIFQIRGDVLQVSARSFGGKFKDCAIPLRSIDLEYQPRSIRLYFLLVFPLVMAGLCALALWSLLHQSFIPPEATFSFFCSPAVGLVISLLLAVRGSRRVEFFQFNNLWGRPLFAIIRERQQSAECDSFIAALIAQIELAQADLSSDERTKLSRQVADENPVLVTPEFKISLWIVSLICGLIAAGLPLVPGAEYLFSALLLPIVMVFCSLGAAAGVYSFIHKEPFRWLSLIGLSLSLVPIIFY